MRRKLPALALGLFIAVAAPASAMGESRSPCAEGSNYQVAAANAAGEVLVAWQQARVERGQCQGSVAEAASGSSTSRFSPLGAISARGLSFPTSAFLDRAGNGWVVGDHEEIVGGKYGQEFEKSGAWFAFRAAGRRLRRAVELAPSNQPTDPLIAGNQAGSVVIAWNTQRGAYLAWGAPSGRISRPAFYGHGLYLTGAGVDEAGRALLAGDYPDPSSSSARAIVVITGRAGSFSRPRILAAAPRKPRRSFFGFFGEPVMASGVNGQAVIAWQSRPNPNNGISHDTLVYRRADGRFTRPRSFAIDFLGTRSPLAEPNRAIIDGSGRALLLTRNTLGVEEVTVSAQGRPSAPRRIITGDLGQPSLAGNAAGEAIVTWSQLQGTGGINYLTGTTQGLSGATQTILSAPNTDDGAPIAVLGAQPPATLIWVHATKDSTDSLLARTSTPTGQTLPVPTPAAP
jgi:hypothetical protein